MTAMKPLLLSLLFATATVKLQGSGPVQVGKPAPSFGGWDLAGRKVLTLASLRRAHGPLLISFGASWCKPCTEGLPRLVQLTRQHPGLLLLFVDVEPDADKALEFAARAGVKGPAILDKFGQIARTYGVAGAGGDGTETLALPRTFLIDASGSVRAIYREEGADLEQVIAADLEAAR